MKCNSCKFLNPDDNKFCINCGAPLGGDPSGSEIDFSDVLGSEGPGAAPLTDSQEDLLKDLEGLSLSTPDIGVSDKENSGDIDLLLSDFEGTISQIVLPDDGDDKAESEPRLSGAVTRMILPGDDEGEPEPELDFGALESAPIVPRKKKSEDIDKSDKMKRKPAESIDAAVMFETDLSELVGQTTGANEAGARLSGAVTKMILPGEEEKIEAELPPELSLKGASELFEEAAEQGDVFGDDLSFSGVELPSRSGELEESGLFAEEEFSDTLKPVKPEIEVLPGDPGGPEDINLFESGLFKADQSIFEPKPVPPGTPPTKIMTPEPVSDKGTETKDAAPADADEPEAGVGDLNEPDAGVVHDLSSLDSQELDSVLAEIGGVVGDVAEEQDDALILEAPTESPIADESALDRLMSPEKPETEELSLDALDAVLQGPSESDSGGGGGSLDDFLKELEGSSPLGVTVETRQGVGVDKVDETDDVFETAQKMVGQDLAPEGFERPDAIPVEAPGTVAEEQSAVQPDAAQPVAHAATQPAVQPYPPYPMYPYSPYPYPPQAAGAEAGQAAPPAPPYPYPPYPYPPVAAGPEAGQAAPPAPPYPYPPYPYPPVAAGAEAGQAAPPAPPYLYPPYPYPPQAQQEPSHKSTEAEEPDKAGEDESVTQERVDSSDVGENEIQCILGGMDSPSDEHDDGAPITPDPDTKEEDEQHSSALEDFLSEITIGTDEKSAAPVAEDRPPEEAEEEEVEELADKALVIHQHYREEERVEETTPDDLIRQIESSGDEDERYALVQRLSGLLEPRSVSLFIRLLGDQNSDIRECAVEALGNLGDASAVRPLLRSLGVESQNMRYLCVEALGKIRDVDAVDALIALLDEDDDNMRYVAAEALGRIGSDKGVRPLVNLASSADKDLRYIIAKSLGKIGSIEASSLLVRFLDDEDPEVVVQAIHAMGEIRDPNTATHLVGLLTIRTQLEQLKAVVAALGKIRSIQAVSHLIKLLTRENEELIAEVIAALGAIGDPQAVEPIIDKLNTQPGEPVMRAAVDALGELGSEEAIDSLVDVLERGEFDLKRQVAAALGKIGSSKALGPLTELLHDADVAVRQAAVAALGEIEDPQAIGRLDKLASDPDEGVRRETADALGKIGTEDAIPLLITLLKDSDAEVSQRAVNGLKAIGRPCVEPLTILLPDAGEDVQIKVTSVLGQLGDVRAVNPLLYLLDDASSELREEIFKALIQLDSDILAAGEVSVVMKESYAWIRFGIVRAMGRYNRPEAVELLLKIIEGTFGSGDERALASFPDVGVVNLAREALARIRAACGELLGEFDIEDTVKAILERLVDADYETRRWLIHALGFVQKEASVIALIELLKRDDLDEEEGTIARALRRIRMKMVVEKILESISTASARNRRKLAYALGVLGDVRALNKLTELLQDADEGVRLNALKALSRIGSIQAFDGISDSVKDSSERIRRMAVEVLAKMPDDRAVPFLGTALHDRSSAVRVSAAAALGALQNEKAFPLLIAGLKDESSDVRCSIVRTLGEIGNQKAVESLVPMLKDINSQVRHEAVRSLGKMGDVRAVVSLLEAMDDHDLWVKTEAAKTLRGMGVSALPNLVEALGHPLEEIQRNCVEILSDMACPRLHQLLIDALKNRTKSMRANAAEVFGRLRERSAVVPLLNLLDDRDYEVRERVAYALGAIGDISASVALKQAMKDQNRIVRTAASKAMRMIMEANEIS